MDEHHHKLRELFQRLTAQFIAENSNLTSLITVTNFELSPKLTTATAYISVYPTSAEVGALGFAKRKRSELRDYIKKNARTRIIPRIDFEIDLGERTRH